MPSVQNLGVPSANDTASISFVKARAQQLLSSVSPKLIEFYNNQKDDIEVVFVSSDRGEGT